MVAGLLAAEAWRGWDLAHWRDPGGRSAAALRQRLATYVGLAVGWGGGGDDIIQSHVYYIILYCCRGQVLLVVEGSCLIDACFLLRAL